MDPIFEDALAGRLWAARHDAVPIDPVPRIDVQRGERVSAELYAAIRRVGAAQVGWKLAFTDAATQGKFGTDRPFSAPVFDSSILSGAEVRRSALIAPLLEAEVAVFVDGPVVRPAACIEIADCRFPNWEISLGEALADFGLQGAMRFGQPRAEVGTVDVVVRRNGVVIATGSRLVETALGQLRLLDGRLTSSASRGAIVIATGSMIQPVPLTAGWWELDFGPLGRLDLDVKP